MLYEEDPTVSAAQAVRLVATAILPRATCLQTFTQQGKHASNIQACNCYSSINTCSPHPFKTLAPWLMFWAMQSPSSAPYIAYPQSTTGLPEQIQLMILLQEQEFHQLFTFASGNKDDFGKDCSKKTPEHCWKCILTFFNSSEKTKCIAVTEKPNWY